MLIPLWLFIVALVIIFLNISKIVYARNQLIRNAVREKEIIEESKEIINKYAKNLGRERFSNSSTDPYGIRRYDKWEKKGREYFYQKVLLAIHSASSEIENSFSLKSYIMELIEETAIANQFLSLNLTQSFSGEEYEVFCEKELEEKGWHVIRTPKTGDHGVDLVAEKNSYRLCIQCKRYSRSVGNAAVQEVTAGKSHYQGTHAAVVTNNSFTKKAIELAESNHVMLLHHEELKRLDEILTQQFSFPE